MAMQTGGSPMSDYFKAYIFGYSENMAVNSGEIYGDNLGETGGIALPPTELVVNEGTTGTEIKSLAQTLDQERQGTSRPRRKDKTEDRQGRLD